MTNVTGNQINNDGDASGPIVGGNAEQIGNRYNSHSGASGQHVEVHTGPQRRPFEDYTDSELLQRLTHELGEVRRALLGDPFNRGHNPGLVDMVQSLAGRQTTADAERRHISEQQIAHAVLSEERHRKITSQQSAVMIIIWTTLALVGFEGIAIIILFMQRASQLGG